ncbi:MFS transporter [Gordonia sp. ABSL1-1]|uniref:MFS transporter n=1 Tax=Gordonia sp. ABSL1-1 TaxID=3053923 RepID=UPI00257489F9|nr:MFS transporter [Gordonia sp. ABSL1-1]MDL9936591.1 MFS transporter [Gordonia sp. ABSL1-1]
MSTTPSGTHLHWRSFVSSVRHSPGLGRLLAVRLTSQGADGIFQAALVGAVLFNPERHADPLAVAGGFAVLLLPYSLIGPFAGALLDHWDRRNVLLYANLLRAAIIGIVAISVAAGSPDTVVLISALAATGASRFVAAGLSAGLPHVAAREAIVGINALFTTLGGAMLSVGIGVTLALRTVFGDDNTGSALTMIAGIVIAIVAGLLAHGFGQLELGPDEPDDPGRSALHAVSVGLLHGARAVVRCRPVAGALSAIGAHRLVFGMNTLMILVMARHSGAGNNGVDQLSVVVGFTAAGALIAAILTPISVDRLGRRATLMGALIVGAAAQLTLLSFNMAVICAAALVLGLIGQMAKLCGDVAMQLDIDDMVRGQVFSVQDAVFNIAYVGALTIAALAVPTDGRATGLVVLGVALYLLGVVVVRFLHTTGPRPPADLQPTVETA